MLSDIKMMMIVMIIRKKKKKINFEKAKYISDYYSLLLGGH